jgi:hypothetical protein
MKTLDIITVSRIQKRVETLVTENMDENGEVSFEFISEKIMAEFGETALEEAKKQYDFMYEW